MVDDDDSGVFTAGAIVTVTVNLRRRTMGEVYEQSLQESEQAKVEGVQEKEEEPAAVAAVSVFCLVCGVIFGWCVGLCV